MSITSEPPVPPGEPPGERHAGPHPSELAINALTLRDYFAAQALPQVTGYAPIDAPSIANVAYSLADAMLAERSKP